MAIAFFYAVATGIGGIIGPALYGHNIATGNRTTVFLGYLLGAGLMVLGGLDRGLAGRRRRTGDARGHRPADHRGAVRCGVDPARVGIRRSI